MGLFGKWELKEIKNETCISMIYSYNFYSQETPQYENGAVVLSNEAALCKVPL